MMGLTTPSSTQPSSPSASPALSSTEDRKRNKSESEDNQSQRNRYFIFFTNNNHWQNLLDQIQVPMVPQSQVYPMPSSPKNPLTTTSTITQCLIINQNASNYQSSGLSTSVPPHFTYPISTQPVLQYSTIVSQNTLPSTASTTNSNSTLKQVNVSSPQTKQMSRQTSTNNNDSTVTLTSTQPSAATTMTTTTSNSSASSSHPLSLLANNDRSGIDLFHQLLLLLSICRMIL